MHYKGNKKRVTLIVSILVVLILALATGGVFSKYKETVNLNSVNLEVSSGKLASVFSLQEHKAVQKSDGTYELGTEVVYSNSYRVLPGVAIPKDPYFTLNKQTKIEAYLYVEIINNLGSKGLSYSLTDDWVPLGLGVKGANGGDGHVYSGGTNAAKKITKDFNQNPIKILKDDQITVTNANKSSLGTVNVSFYGYLAQASLANTAKDVFTKCFGGGN
mgnify:CR=1 FL=1